MCAGKTTTLVELVVQSVARGERVLCCAPSNIAVDNLVERITAAAAFNAAHTVKPTAPSTFSSSSSSPPSFHSFRCIRLGHPARLSPAVLSHSLDSVVAASDGAKINRDIEHELASTAKAIHSTRDREERKTLRTQWKALQKELRVRQKKAVKDALDACPVVCATLIGAASSSCAAYRYDMVVIDEAAQAIEVACLIPILLARRRLILAGDHHQLGPVVKSTEAERGGLGLTLMDRIAARPDSASLIHRLSVQYRMNEAIMKWSSGEFYDSQLSAPDDVRQRHLAQLKGVKETDLTLAPLVFIDTAGCDMQEDDDDDATPSTTTPIAGRSSRLFSQSKSNAHEVQLVLRHIRLLLSSGLPLSSITVLSPYLAQISLLRDTLLPLYPSLEIGTIDSMQGRENDAVLISTVRSSPAHTVGFLSDARRINVAVTRARRQVCIIGDSDTLSGDAFLRRLVEYMADHANAEYRSALEYLQEDVEAMASTVTPRSATVSEPASSSPVKRAVPAVAARPKSSAAIAVAGASMTTAAVEEPATAAAPAVEEFDRERIARLCEEVRTGALPSFTFPARMSPQGRRLVHDVAEEVGQGELSHQSEGAKHRRMITLRKLPPAASAAPSLPPARTSAPPLPRSSPPSSPPPTRSNGGSRTVADVEPLSARRREEQRLAAVSRMEAKAKPQMKSAGSAPTPPLKPNVTKEVQAADVAIPASSGAFDGLGLEAEGSGGEIEEEKEEPGQSGQSQDERQLQSTAVAVRRKKSKASAAGSAVATQSSPTSSSSSLPAPTAGDDDDLASFLDSLSKGISVCAAPACKRPVMHGAVCPHCHLAHCLSHSNSILHGCAADAKEAALARDMRAFHSSKQGRAVSGLKDDARRQLSQKVHSKADALRKAGEAAPRKKKANEKKDRGA